MTLFWDVCRAGRGVQARGTSVRLMLFHILCGTLACNPLHTVKDQSEILDAANADEAAWSIEGQTTVSSRWWRQLNDPLLDEAVEKMLGENLQLQQVVHRVRRARATARLAGSARWPDASASLNKSRTARQGLPLRFGIIDDTTLSVNAAFEVDMWNRLGSLSKASEMRAAAAQSDAEALGLTLTATFAGSWIDLAEAHENEMLLQEQLRTNQTLLELASFRFAAGLTTAADVLQQKQQLLATKGLLPNIEGQKARAINQLSVLMGKAPNALNTPKQLRLVQPGPLPKLGMPADLLLRRPDLNAARQRVQAADLDISAALASRLPSLRITGQSGLPVASLGEFLDNIFWTVGASVTQPLLDGGRRRADADEKEAALNVALLEFRQTFLVAVREVEDAIQLESASHDRLDNLEAELGVARTLLKETRRRYTAGLTSYLPVLNAVRALQTKERELITATSQRLRARIQLLRALAGPIPPANLSAAPRSASRVADTRKTF